MSLYPSLEDMRVDRLYQAQFETESAYEPSAPPPYMPQIESSNSALPYPIGPSAPLYPSLSEYMGLELTPAAIAANIPNYDASSSALVKPTVGGLIAPLSGNNRGLQRALVTNGIREMVLCKDGSGRLGLRVQAVNNGIFVSLVSADSSSAKAGLRFGDQILQVHGKNVAGLTADAVHILIRKGPESGISLVVRDRPLERTVTLHKDSAGRIGFTFKNGKITALVLESSAARNGLLTEHQLLEINGQNVVGMKDKEITNLINEGGTIITVTIIPHFIYEHMTKRIAPSLFSTMDHSIW